MRVRVKQSVSFLIIASFLTGQIVPIASAQNALNLPAPGAMVTQSASFVPPMLMGMRVTPGKPFQFDFILDSGNADLTQGELKQEATKLIKYFLASLTIPEDDLWVNLSPYEKGRIIPDEFVKTEMGRDLLAQDYVLKQLTASLIYPEEDLGKEFWDRVYAKARQLYGTEEIPINTFNKVWILPDKAVVYENKDAAFVLESHLKVMLDADYLALKNNLDNRGIGADQLPEHKVKEINDVSSQIVKEIVIPEIEKEVNHGQNFAKLRQVYHSLILAKWYKQKLKTSILNREYSDQRKIAGIDIGDGSVKERIYQRYLKAFKKGVFDYIKEDYDTTTQQIIPRKYFSGGMAMKVPLQVTTDPVRLTELDTRGKLSWIRGVYRQPRASAGFVNEFIAQQFAKGNVTEGQPIQLAGGQQAEVYVVDSLLKATGQFGHIGLGAKEDREGTIAYKDNGLPVVYLDSGYAENSEVRSNEKFKVEKWEEQKETLGWEQGLDRPLTALEMREWIKNNTTEAAGLLKAWDSEAPSIEPLFREAEGRNLLPTDEEIARTYNQPEDFRDLNLAAGRTVTIEDLRKVPMDVLQNTSAIFDKILLFIKRLENPRATMRESGVHALGLLMEKGVIGEKIIREMKLIEKLAMALGDPESWYVRVVAMQILGNNVQEWGELKEEIIQKLMANLKNGNKGDRLMAAWALEKGTQQGGELLAGEVTQVMKTLGAGYYIGEGTLTGAEQTLGMIIQQGGELSRKIISELVKALGSDYESRAAAAWALGYGAQQWGEFADQIIPMLMADIENVKTINCAMAAEALGYGTQYWNESTEEITQKLLKALREGYFAARSSAAKALGYSTQYWNESAEEIKSELVRALRDNERHVRIAAEQALGYSAKRWNDLPDDGILALVAALGDRESWYVRTEAAQTLGNEVQQGRLKFLSMEEIFDYYSLLQKKRKDQTKILEDGEINSREVLILKIHSVIEGKVNPKDVKYAEQIADATKDRDSLRVVLDTIREWAVDGSADAQNYLEGRVGQIISRNPKNPQGYVETDERDVAYIEATAGSFRQRSLLPIFVSKRFHPRVRARVMKLLAERGYIDSGYAKVRESDVDRYLNLISAVYDEFNLIAPKILIENLIDRETTINSLKAVRPRLDEIIAKKDYRVLIKELSRSEEMMFAYYMLHQSPFQYQGTDPISYERFKKLVKASVESLDDEERDMVELRLKNGFVAAGLDEERALQIARRLLKGGPPLPDDSPYLDEEGNFMPQKIDVLSTLGDSDASDEARRSFNSSMYNIVLILKINDLMSRIPKGIEKRFPDDEKGKSSMQKQYKWVISGIRLGVDLNKILTELKELNDKIFPPHGRKRDLDAMVAQAINKQIRNTPMYQDVITTIAAKKKETQPQTGADGQASERRIYLEDFDINGLVRNLDKMVNILKSKQKAERLTSIEKQIIKEDEINGGHVIRIFFANLLQRMQLGKKSPLYAIFRDLETHLIIAFDNYTQAVSQKVDIRNVPQVVYVDFVSKFNLMEFFRFADGAHCCLTSDPNVSSQYGTGVYKREMPRYLTNATSFWWQFTADIRSGKQIGWFENWFGVNEGGGDKVFVGTELTYLSPSYYDRNLQNALLSQVERILFSTKVTKVAQANFGHHASNAMSPPSGYEKETMDITKLQSLRDGSPIYEDAPVETNMSSRHEFYVKNNPGDIPVAATVEAGRYNVSAEFVPPSEITPQLIDRLLKIEKEVFPEHKLGGEDYMREQLDSPNVLFAVYRDQDTDEIVGYRYAVPATEAWNLPETSEYDEYRKEDVLYGADVAIQPKYWGKADMGKKFRAFFRKAKEEGYKYFAVHTESVNSVRPGVSLSQKYQGMGFEVKLKEQNWGDTGDEYNFLVLDLSKVDSAMLGDVVTSSPVQSRHLQSRNGQNPGGIDFNLDLLELETQGQERNFYLPGMEENFEHIRIDGGLMPIILNVIPIPSPLPLLGINSLSEQDVIAKNTQNNQLLDWPEFKEDISNGKLQSAVSSFNRTENSRLGGPGIRNR